MENGKWKIENASRSILHFSFSIINFLLDKLVNVIGDGGNGRFDFFFGGEIAVTVVEYDAKSGISLIHSCCILYLIFFVC